MINRFERTVCWDTEAERCRQKNVSDYIYKCSQSSGNYYDGVSSYGYSIDVFMFETVWQQSKLYRCRYTPFENMGFLET